MTLNPDRVREALEHWESYLAGIHDCDMGEPEAQSVLFINEAARAWLNPDIEAAAERLKECPEHLLSHADAKEWASSIVAAALHQETEQ